MRSARIREFGAQTNFYAIEPTTAVVRGGKRSLRARITAREALLNVILGPD